MFITRESQPNSEHVSRSRDRAGKIIIIYQHSVVVVSCILFQHAKMRCWCTSAPAQISVVGTCSLQKSRQFVIQLKAHLHASEADCTKWFATRGNRARLCSALSYRKTHTARANTHGIQQKFIIKIKVKRESKLMIRSSGQGPCKCAAFRQKMHNLTCYRLQSGPAIRNHTIPSHDIFFYRKFANRPAAQTHLTW